MKIGENTEIYIKDCILGVQRKTTNRWLTFRGAWPFTKRSRRNDIARTKGNEKMSFLARDLVAIRATNLMNKIIRVMRRGSLHVT